MPNTLMSCDMPQCQIRKRAQHTADASTHLSHQDEMQGASHHRWFALLGLLLLAATAPAQAQYHMYWGDMHGHTSHSDGKGSLDDYFVHARDVAKLDFVVVSDHDFGNTAPWQMPKETWTLTQDKAEKYTVDGKFVTIAGYEWTSQPKYWTPEEPIFEGPVSRARQVAKLVSDQTLRACAEAKSSPAWRRA